MHCSHRLFENKSKADWIYQKLKCLLHYFDSVIDEGRSVGQLSHFFKLMISLLVYFFVRTNRCSYIQPAGYSRR